MTQQIETETMRNRIILAALLHDIGKFWQRADKYRGGGSVVDHTSEELTKLICPADRNYDEYHPKYQHALWTNAFFETQKDIFNNISQNNSFIFRVNKSEINDNLQDNLVNLAAYHHNPHSFLQGIIQLADWWSSGLDRRVALDEEADENYPTIKWGKYAFRKVPLHSIFNLLNMKAEEGLFSNQVIYAHDLNELSLDETLFPRQIEQQSKYPDLDYDRLWRKFIAEFQLLPLDSWNGFINSLIYLLRKYTWCIPSSTIDLPYVSLFEHLKSTAAIAGCLYDYSQANPDSIIHRGTGYSLKVKENEDQLVLVSIDISGIQDFIYNIASSKAYKSLKGRSFYLTLLLDSVVTKFLSKIGHTTANIIYASGGKAFILAPNTDKTQDVLKHLQDEIDSKIWNEHHGRLFVAMTSLSFSYHFHDEGGDAILTSCEIKDLSDLASLWTNLIKKGDKVKQRRFKSLLKAKYNKFFSPLGLDGIYSTPKEICSVTGEPIIGEPANLNDGRQADPIWVLPQVYQQTELGNVLKNCDYILKYSKASGKENEYLNSRTKAYIEPCQLGVHYYLFKKSELIDNEAQFRIVTSGDGTEVLRINETDFLWDSKLKGKEASYGYWFYGGNDQPASGKVDSRNLNLNKTLEEICQYEKITSEGEVIFDTTRLGVLRMDVDNLGSLFSRGFEKKFRSFAAYGTLSFMLDTFFSGYLNIIRNKYKDEVAVLYSGGDDVFAIGRWDAVIKFAADVRGKFAEFTKRDFISISGGMVMTGPKYPISKSAELAGNEEARAKGFKKNGKEVKNAFCFYGEVVSWDNEFETIQKNKNIFVNLIQSHGMTAGILHQLQRYKIIKEDSNRRYLQKGKEKDWSYKWHSAYHLGRYAMRYREKNEVKIFVAEISKNLLYNDQIGADRYLDLISLSARWAEFELKLFEKK